MKITYVQGTPTVTDDLEKNYIGGLQERDGNGKWVGRPGDTHDTQLERRFMSEKCSGKHF